MFQLAYYNLHFYHMYLHTKGKDSTKATEAVASVKKKSRLALRSLATKS